MKNRALLLFFSLFFITTSNAQKWIGVENNSFKSQLDQRLTVPSEYESYELDFDHFKSILNNAPKRFESTDEGILIIWPMPGNENQTFRVKRSDVFHPDLAKKYPDIKAFTGHSASDPTAILKISISHKGIEGMLLSSRHETIYLDRLTPKSKEKYILYERSNYHRDLAEGEGTCTVEVPDDGYKGIDHSVRFGDCQLRKYRLALACTGEYATFHGGNIPDVLAEYNASLVRLNGMFERDLGITMELIANTDEIIFLSANTDPYTNSSGSAMLGQNQSTVDQIIGFDNYDIGHVYSTGGGGVASLRSPCTNRKARGVTGLGNPTGDFFWVDYVAHEMGHQFGGNHTFNNSCLSPNGTENRNSGTAIEPGSGTTIMAYAGICSPDLQNNSDDYFHSITQLEVANFVVAGNGNCAEIISTDNSPPEIESITSPSNVLPSRTPFFLTVNATDPDNDMLTYCWEQKDNEIVNMPPESSSTGGPTFRSFDPNESPTRYFPILPSILTGANGTTWEVLPNATREMNFNITVRDNTPLGGCTDNDDLTINFTSAAGPFLITSQNSSTTWSSGDMEIITWDVANTDIAPVSCDNVDIIFSLDRGNNFDIMLAENVPNDGEHEISVPFKFTSQGRIMLKCSSSTFFDINNRDINVIAPFSAEVSPTDILVCPEESATFILDYTVFDSSPIPVTFDLNGLPTGATFTFSPDQTEVDSEVVLTIENLTSDLVGSYELSILTQGETLTQMQMVNLTVSPSEDAAVIILNPQEGQTGVSNNPTLSWDVQGGIVNYQVEVSNNPKFDDIIFSGETSDYFITVLGLSSSTIYYWRVRGSSDCFDAVWDGFQSFQTGGLICNTDQTDANLIIANDNSNTVESDIELTSQGFLGGLEVSMTINHTWIGDLSARIRAPNGLVITLFEQPGVPGTNFGCEEDNIVATFSSGAINTASDFEISCDPNGNAIEGIFQPLESFSFLENTPISGTWTLIVEDIVGPDGGELVEWSITTCELSSLGPGEVLTNLPLELINTTEGIINNTFLEVENSDPANTKFVVRSVPASGELQKWNETMSIFESLNLGDSFTQEDVNLNKIMYTLSDVGATEDNFAFDTEDDQSRYTANNNFVINVNISVLTISSTITNHISCFGSSDGQIEVMGIGGIPDYTYSINNGPFESQNIFENLGLGEYTITVKDEIGTEISSDLLTISEPDQITFVFFPGDNEIIIEAGGGTGSLMYSLDGVNYTTESTIEIFDGTTYRIYVKDENECMSQSFNELTFYQIGEVHISIVDVDCKGEATGALYINSVIGGLSPYTYQLDEIAPTTETSFTNLQAGTYTLTVRDADFNTFMMSDILITEPEFELEIFYDIAGSTVVLSGSGGTESYIYSINNLNFTDNGEFLNLANGDYIAYILDANGCEDSIPFTILVSATNELSLDQILLFPNPTQFEVILGNPSTISFDYQIIDITGKVVSKNSAMTNEGINVEHLTSGLYMIKVSYKEDSQFFKLSKI